jgi:hypothetical protein
MASHKVMTLEGSLSIPKFIDYYSKLMQPANRKKREPYNFLIPIAENIMGDFMNQITTNMSHAFAIQVPPYKIKLWIVTVDGDVDYRPLPVLPGIVFGMLEVPPALFTTQVINVFNPMEINQMIVSIGMHLQKIGRTDLGSFFVSRPQPPQVGELAPPTTTYLIPPNQPTAMAVPSATPSRVDQPSTTDKSLSRVFEIINRKEDVVDLDDVTAEAERIMDQVGRQPMESSLSKVAIPSFPASVRAGPSLGALPISASAYQALARPVGTSTSFRPPGSMPSMTRPPMHAGPPSMMKPPPGSSGWSSAAASKIVIGAPSTGPSMDQLPAPRKGICRFFNSAQGCQQGRNCKFSHNCSVCGSESHSGPEHYGGNPGGNSW